MSKHKATTPQPLFEDWAKCNAPTKYPGAYPGDDTGWEQAENVGAHIEARRQLRLALPDHPVDCYLKGFNDALEMITRGLPAKPDNLGADSLTPYRQRLAKEVNAWGWREGKHVTEKGS